MNGIDFDTVFTCVALGGIILTLGIMVAALIVIAAGSLIVGGSVVFSLRLGLRAAHTARRFGHAASIDAHSTSFTRQDSSAPSLLNPDF